jgi:hypothetical protein
MHDWIHSLVVNHEPDTLVSALTNLKYIVEKLIGFDGPNRRVNLGEDLSLDTTVEATKLVNTLLFTHFRVTSTGLGSYIDFLFTL